MHKLRKEMHPEYYDNDRSDSSDEDSRYNTEQRCGNTGLKFAKLI